MTKGDMIEMVEARINTEYKKYHNTPVDFAKSAALKIVSTLEHDSKQVKKLNIVDVSNSFSTADIQRLLNTCDDIEDAKRLFI